MASGSNAPGDTAIATATAAATTEPTSSSSPPPHRQRAASFSSLHSSHHNFLRTLSDLQTVPRTRQASLTHHLFSSESFVRRLEQNTILKGHRGCVNTISWDDTGEFLVSGSDDLHLNIYRPLDPKPLVHSIPSGHSGNVFSAKFMTRSSASLIVSCCADGVTRLTDVNRYVEKSHLSDWYPVPGFSCHSPMTMTYEVMPDLESRHIFYDCSDDGRINRYDSRISSSCECEEDSGCSQHTFIDINSPRGPSSEFTAAARILRVFRLRRPELGVSAITQRPENPVYIAAACGDDTVRIYDSRYVANRGHRGAQVYSFSPYVPSGWVVGPDNELTRGVNKRRSTIGTRITSLKYDPCWSGQLLASYSRGNCYLIDPSGMVTDLTAPGTLQNKDQASHRAQANQTCGTDVKGKRRWSSSMATDTASAGPSASKRQPGSWSPPLHRRTPEEREADEMLVTEKPESDKPVQEEMATLPKATVHAEVESAEPSLLASKNNSLSAEEAEWPAGHVRFRLRPSGSQEQEHNEEANDNTNLTSSKQEDNNNSPEAVMEETKNKDEVDLDDKDKVKDKDNDNEDDKDNDNDNDDGEDEDEDGDKDEEEDGDDDGDGDGDGSSEDDESFWMSVESETKSVGSDDEDASDPSMADEKEYWVRRSYQAGKSDIVQVYSGHQNVQTMASFDDTIKEANFIGPNSEFVMSGSDDGRIFFWDKQTGRIVNAIKGDEVVVNCLQPHPHSNFVLAASGIDHTIKIFMPTADKTFDLSKIRGVRRPTSFSHEIQPSTYEQQASLSGCTVDTLDKEQAYRTVILDADSSDDDNDEFNLDDSDDDDDNDDDDDDEARGEGGDRQPHRLLLQIIRQLARGRSRMRQAAALAAATDEDNDGDNDDNVRDHGRGRGEEEDQGHMDEDE
ncbi:DDB1- and CUL4-associated factor 6 [Dissophora globulifera]|uniref:DDB1- and CUL4-associated factor 6 n=1 Tax=Dissophora globulifera TaxID=979702 RepID=A0A9P6RIV1_9FUNG|nr:DDB1- and CUL4-associated factor 6 [Dissophora globulifera]